MEERRSSGRARRPIHRSFEEDGWECSVCTYKNPPEAFKCDMCECRKGTATRKPRINQQIVTIQQVAQQFAPPAPKKERKETKHRQPGNSSSSTRKSKHPRLKNIDRSSGQTMEVTVNGVTVVVTDYKLKKERRTTGETSSASHSGPTSPLAKEEMSDNSDSVRLSHGVKDEQLSGSEDSM